MENGKSKLIVRGRDFMKPPLLETSDASIIEFYDSFGDMNALMVKMLNDECWGLVTRDNPVWLSMLMRYGYVKPEATSLNDVKAIIEGKKVN